MKFIIIFFSFTLVLIQGCVTNSGNKKAEEKVLSCVGSPKTGSHIKRARCRVVTKAAVKKSHEDNKKAFRNLRQQKSRRDTILRPTE